MYTATGPGLVEKVPRSQASLPPIMEELDSDGEKVLLVIRPRSVMFI